MLSSFNFYSFYHPQDLISYYLIRNKQEGCLLLAEKPSIDYFLIMQDNYVINEIEMIANLRKMEKPKLQEILAQAQKNLEKLTANKL